MSIESKEFGERVSIYTQRLTLTSPRQYWGLLKRYYLINPRNGNTNGAKLRNLLI